MKNSKNIIRISFRRTLPGEAALGAVVVVFEAIGFSKTDISSDGKDENE